MKDEIAEKKYVDIPIETDLVLTMQSNISYSSSHTWLDRDGQEHKPVWFEQALGESHGAMSALASIESP